MARPSRYKKKYAKELMNGLRYSPYMSIDEVCRRWNINSRATYYNWLKEYPEFKEAHDKAEIDYAAAIYKNIMDVTLGKVKGHGTMAALVAKNLLGWVDKTETKIESKAPITNLNISILPSKEPLEVIDVTPSNENVLEFKNDETNS